MMVDNEEKEGTKAKILETEEIQWIVPVCCREGWDSCKHVINRPQKPRKSNVGL